MNTGVLFRTAINSLSLVDKIENVQLDTARIITGATKLTPIAKIYEETGWGKLSIRQKLHKLFLLHKILTNKKPGNLQSLIFN